MLSLKGRRKEQWCSNKCSAEDTEWSHNPAQMRCSDVQLWPILLSKWCPQFLPLTEQMSKITFFWKKNKNLSQQLPEMGKYTIVEISFISGFLFFSAGDIPSAELTAEFTKSKTKKISGVELEYSNQCMCAYFEACASNLWQCCCCNYGDKLT